MGTVMLALNPGTDHCDFEASLLYVQSSGQPELHSETLSSSPNPFKKE